MKRNALLPVMVAVPLLVAGLLASGAKAQQRKPTAKGKMATVDYLVGSWSCAHTVGTFSGKYATNYTKTLGGLWLKQTYDGGRRDAYEEVGYRISDRRSNLSTEWQAGDRAPRLPQTVKLTARDRAV